MKTGKDGNLRGAIFELLVKHLATQCGYLPVTATSDVQIYKQGALPMVHGLGEGHNADVLLSYPFHMAMTPQMRLLIECKGYQKPVGLGVIRGAVGLRLDLNAFRQLSDNELQRRSKTRRPTSTPISYPFYNVAVASLKGFSAHAQSFAATHHIELLDYGGLPVLARVPGLLAKLKVNGFSAASFDGVESPGELPDETDSESDDADEATPEHTEPKRLPDAVCKCLDAAVLGADETVVQRLESYGISVSDETGSILNELSEIIKSVRYTYMASIANRFHVHMISPKPLQIDSQKGELEVAFRANYSRENRGHWFLAPSEYQEGVKLEFALPQIFLQQWENAGFDRQATSSIKDHLFEGMDIIGPVSLDGGAPVIRHIAAKLESQSLAIARREAMDAPKR